MSTDAPAEPQKRRARKRIWIPSVLLGFLAAAGGWLMWRGTNAETVERNPTSVAEGAVTQLLTQDRRTFVRTAIVVPAPTSDVWKVVTDYDSHPQFIRYVGQLSSQKLDDGRVHLTGVAHSRLWGDFPFEFDVGHDEQPEEGEYYASWHQEGQAANVVERGGWTVKRLSDGQSLLILSNQTEISGYPNFLVRSIVRDRAGSIVRSVRDEVLKRGRR